MRFRQLLTASAVSAGLLLATPAFGQGLRAGATVTDAQGGEVGTITAVEGDAVLLRTDRHEVRVPATSFAVSDTGIVFSVTREQLNADLDRIQAQAAQAVRIGASVHDRSGAVAGPIEAMDDQSITVRIGEGIVRLPRGAVAPGPNGLTVNAALADLQAAAVPAPPAAGGDESGN